MFLKFKEVMCLFCSSYLFSELNQLYQLKFPFLYFQVLEKVSSGYRLPPPMVSSLKIPNVPELNVFNLWIFDVLLLEDSSINNHCTKCFVSAFNRVVQELYMTWCWVVGLKIEHDALCLVSFVIGWMLGSDILNCWKEALLSNCK